MYHHKVHPIRKQWNRSKKNFFQQTIKDVLGDKYSAMGASRKFLAEFQAMAAQGFVDAYRRKQKYQKSLDPTVCLYADISKAAYRDPPPESISGWTIKHYEPDKYVIYQSPSNPNEVIISFRGTDFNLTHQRSRNDMMSDLSLILNNETSDPRFIGSLQVAKDALERGWKVSVCGHSLGGSLALHVAQKYPQITAYIFNPGAVDSNIDKCAGKCSNVHSYRTGGDLVSIVSKKLPKMSKATSTNVKVKGVSHYNFLEQHRSANFTKMCNSSVFPS